MHPCSPFIDCYNETLRIIIFFSQPQPTSLKKFDLFLRFSDHKCFIVFVPRSLLWEFLVMRPLASLLDVLGITENLQTLWSWLPELSPLFRFQHCFFWHCLYSRRWIAEENGESWCGQITYPFERYRDSTLEWNLP